MSIIKKTIIALLVLTLISGTVFAAGSSEKTTAEAKVELSITYATGDTLTKEVTHNIITEFQKANPDIKILENLSISTGAYLDSLKTLNAADQMPDVFECRDTATFVRADMLQPISENLLKLVDSPIGVYGTVYTLPYVAQTPFGIIYNKALFEKDGWDQEPKTYAEFLTLCETIKKAGYAPLVAGISDIWHEGFLFGNFWANYIGNKNSNWIADRYENKVHFTDPDFQAAMDKMISLFTSGYVEAGFMSTKESQCVSVLVAEKAAMYYAGTFAFTQITEADPDFQIGWFPIPTEDGSYTLIGGSTPNGWALTKKAAQDPLKVEAFERFCTFFLSQAQYAPFCKATSQFPTTTEKMIYDVDGVMAEVLDSYNSHKAVLNWNQGVGANELPPSFRNFAYKTFQEAMMKKSTVAQCCKALDAEWDNLTRDFNPTKLVKVDL